MDASSVVVLSGMLLFAAMSLRLALVGFRLTYRPERLTTRAKVGEIFSAVVRIIAALLIFLLLRAILPDGVAEPHLFGYALLMFSPALLLMGWTVERMLGLRFS